MWKYCVLTHKRHCPAWIRVCWCIACKNRFNGLSSRSVKIFLRTKEEKKNWVVTFAIWGEVTPGTILTKCGLWGDMVDVITCAIFRDCRLRGVGVVRGVSLPSRIDLTRRHYNTGHTTVWPCDYTLNNHYLEKVTGGHSNRYHAVSYSPSIVTMAVSSTV